MSDERPLIERLREGPFPASGLCREAADEIDELTADRDQWKGRADQISEERDTLQSRDSSSMLVREIVAWFDVMHSKYVQDGTPVELSEEWPSDWMRRAREILE